MVNKMAKFKNSFDQEYFILLKNKFLSRFRNEFKFIELNYKQNAQLIELLIQNNKVACINTEPKIKKYDNLVFADYVEKGVSNLYYDSPRVINLVFPNSLNSKDWFVDQNAVIGTLDHSKIPIIRVINYYVELCATIQKQINTVRKQKTLLYLININERQGKDLKINMESNEVNNFQDFGIVNGHVIEPTPQGDEIFQLQTYHDKVLQELNTLLGFNSVIQQEKKEHLINAEIVPQMETVESYRQDFIDCLQGFGDRVGQVLGLPLTLSVTSELVKEKLALMQLKQAAGSFNAQNGQDFSSYYTTDNISSQRAPESGTFSFSTGSFHSGEEGNYNFPYFPPLPGPDQQPTPGSDRPGTSSNFEFRFNEFNFDFFNDVTKKYSDKLKKKQEVISPILKKLTDYLNNNLVFSKDLVFNFINKGLDKIKNTTSFFKDKFVNATKEVDRFTSLINERINNEFDQFKEWGLTNWNQLKYNTPFLLEKTRSFLISSYDFINNFTSGFVNNVWNIGEKIISQSVKFFNTLSQKALKYYEKLVDAIAQREELKKRARELEALKKRTNQQEQELKGFQDKINDLEIEIFKLRELSNTYEKRIEKIKADKKKSEQEKIDDIKRLEQELKDKEKKLKYSFEKIKELNKLIKELEGIKNRNQELEEKLKAYIKEREILKEKFTIRDEKIKVQSELDSLDKSEKHFNKVIDYLKILESLIPTAVEDFQWSVLYDKIVVDELPKFTLAQQKQFISQAFLSIYSAQDNSLGDLLNVFDLLDYKRDQLVLPTLINLIDDKIRFYESKLDFIQKQKQKLKLK